MECENDCEGCLIDNFANCKNQCDCLQYEDCIYNKYRKAQYTIQKLETSLKDSESNFEIMLLKYTHLLELNR